MKNTKTTIPLSLREQLRTDPTYGICSLFGQGDHICGGRVTWEHAIRYAGKSLQSRWSIVPLCAKAHEVDFYQDAGTMNKELNIWIALNQATDADLIAISKAENYIAKRSYLNNKYGPYKRLFPPNFKKVSNVA